MSLKLQVRQDSTRVYTFIEYVHIKYTLRVFIEYYRVMVTAFSKGKDN